MFVHVRSVCACILNRYHDHDGGRTLLLPSGAVVHAPKVSRDSKGRHRANVVECGACAERRAIHDEARVEALLDTMYTGGVQ